VLSHTNENTIQPLKVVQEGLNQVGAQRSVSRSHPDVMHCNRQPPIIGKYRKLRRALIISPPPLHLILNFELFSLQVRWLRKSRAR